MAVHTISSTSIVKHTTASFPRPHVLYIAEVTFADPNSPKREVARRYSEFLNLHRALGDSAVLPPKRMLVTSFLPSVWLDDSIVAERKVGLAAYLAFLLHSPQYSAHPALLAFLAPAGPNPAANFDLEDALSSTLSRKAAMAEHAKHQSHKAHAAAATHCRSLLPRLGHRLQPPAGL